MFFELAFFDLEAWFVRLADCPMSGKKPAVVISDDHSVWIGNTTDASLTVSPGELFGFGRGSYEQKAVSPCLSLPQLLVMLFVN